MRMLALAIVLLAAAPASADWFSALGYGVYAARAGDVISTEIALQRPGISESNTLFQNRGARIATMAGAPAINFLTAKLHRQHPRLAVVVRIAAIVVWSSAAAHNSRVGL